MMKKEASLYFHINNGGVSVTVERRLGAPLLRMEANHFGHPVGAVGVYVRPDHFQRLSEFFAEMAKLEFTSDEYAAVAEAPRLWVDGRAGDAPPTGAENPSADASVMGRQAKLQP